MGVKRLGKPPVAALEAVHLGHGHEEVPPGAADLALGVPPLLAGARVAEAGREAVAQPEPAEEVGPHDRVAPPPPGLGGVVEHDDGGAPPMCSKQSLSPRQTQTSFSSAKTSHTPWLEYGKDIGR